MQKNEIKTEGLKKVRKIIDGRTLVVAAAFLIQFALILGGFIFLSDYSFVLYGFFIIISASVVIYLYNARGIPDFKLVWMLPIIVLPVVGSLLYLYFTMQPGTRLIYKRLTELSEETRKYVTQKPEVKERLRMTDPQTAHLADYLSGYADSPVYDHTSVKYYALGDYQYEDILSELKKAEKFIFLEFFIIAEGEMWESILDILKEKVKEGVEVRVMYDGTCVLSLLPYFYPELLEKEWIACKMFAPIKPVFSTHYNNRDHRKILVIDGKTAFTGGTNLADEYINRKLRFGHWKDTAVMIKGKAVENFTYMFLEMWNVSEKRPEDYQRYRTPREFSMPNDGFVIPYGSCPYGSERVGKQVYMDILNTAKDYVHIMTPYLILDHEFLMTLIYAAKRGVEVRIIMPHIPDKKTAFALAKTYYNELLEAGVEIYEYKPGFVHAKVFVSDDEKATVGTINLDYRSFYHHFECGLFMYRNSQIQYIEKDFQETLEKCIRIQVSDYKKLTLGTRALGKILRPFAPLM